MCLYESIIRYEKGQVDHISCQLEKLGLDKGFLDRMVDEVFKERMTQLDIVRSMVNKGPVEIDYFNKLNDGSFSSEFQKAYHAIGAEEIRFYQMILSGVGGAGTFEEAVRAVFSNAIEYITAFDPIVQTEKKLCELVSDHNPELKKIYCAIFAAAHDYRISKAYEMFGAKLLDSKMLC